MWNVVFIILAVAVVLILAWLVLFGIVLVDVIDETTVCSLTLGLACKNGKVKGGKNSDPKKNTVDTYTSRFQNRL
jgi:hypothetical protein